MLPYLTVTEIQIRKVDQKCKLKFHLLIQKSSTYTISNRWNANVCHSEVGTAYAKIITNQKIQRRTWSDPSLNLLSPSVTSSWEFSPRRLVRGLSYISAKAHRNTVLMSNLLVFGRHWFMNVARKSMPQLGFWLAYSNQLDDCFALF